MEQRRSSQLSVVTEPSTNGLKKEVWKLKAPRKIKHFIWQAISGFVASASKLKERHCGQDSSCQRCGVDQETINHLLFECPPALQCWALSDIPSSPGLFPCSSLFANIATLIHYSKEQNQVGARSLVFPWIMWYLWKARNNKCFSNEDTTPMETLQLACQEVDAWRTAQMVESTFTAEEINQPIVAREVPDMECQWRCKVDASWLETSDGIGMGFVLFDQEKEVLLGQRKGPQTESPLHAEAETLCWAIKEIRNRGLSRVIFESDCQQLVLIIQQKKEWPALDPELDDIQVLISFFNMFSLKFISRSANVRADGLVKNARSRVQSFSSFEVKDPLRLAIETSL